MKGHFYKPNCHCADPKRCKCNATWTYVIDVGTPSARKQKKKGGFKTKKEAQLAAAAVLLEVQNGTFVKESESSFEDFVKEWLILYTDTGLAKESSVRVRKHESGKLVQEFKGLKLKSINRKMYQTALTALKLKGLSDRTLIGIHCTGKMIFRKALELNYIKNDPTIFAVVPRTQQTVEEAERDQEVPKYLERAELANFLAVARQSANPTDGPIFVTLAYTGVRVGELGALKWKDINFTERTITINKTLYMPKNNCQDYKLHTPKTKKSRRVLEVDAVVIAELKAHQARQNIIRMEHRDKYKDNDFVFAQTMRNFGQPLSAHRIRRSMKQLLIAAGLETNLSPHSLRHTHTSLLAEAGISLEEIMDRLGHANDIMAKRVYLHVTKAMKSLAAQKFSELMNGM